MNKKNIKSSAIYHIKDNIENFNLSLSFRHINSLLNLPKFDINTGRSAVEEITECDKDSVKVITIKWQEKLFSAQDIEFYRDITNCSTDAQKSYHQLILRNDDDSLLLPTEPIFTYVDEDNFTPKEEQSPIEKATMSTHVAMYVFAALNPDTLLVSLRWQPTEKILHIYPDFNSFRDNPYFIEIDTDYRHLYAYGFENISKQSSKGRHATSYVQLQLPEIPHWEGIDELSMKFDMPPKRTRRISVLFEIRRAEGYDYDDIHVRYHIRLPERTILEKGLLTGSTHSSTRNGDGASYFCHCWEIALLCEEDFELGSLCRVYFEVISIDSWERERVEGYSYLSFFLEQGSEELVLPCQRPIERGVIEKLTRYFVGGRRKFDFEKFFVEQDDGFYNRYGISLLTTGTLMVRCQRISQRNPELLRPLSRRMTGMTLEDIMKAYREARRRLEAIVLD